MEKFDLLFGTSVIANYCKSDDYDDDDYNDDDDDDYNDDDYGDDDEEEE